MYYPKARKLKEFHSNSLIYLGFRERKSIAKFCFIITSGFLSHAINKEWLLLKQL